MSIVIDNAGVPRQAREGNPAYGLAHVYPVILLLQPKHYAPFGFGEGVTGYPLGALGARPYTNAKLTAPGKYSSKPSTPLRRANSVKLININQYVTKAHDLIKRFLVFCIVQWWGYPKPGVAACFKAFVLLVKVFKVPVRSIVE